MDFLGIGPLELLLILILAFLFFGPEKLPEIASKIGRVYRNLTKATGEINRTINEEISTEKQKKEGLKAEPASPVSEKPEPLPEPQIVEKKGLDQTEVVSTVKLDENRNN